MGKKILLIRSTANDLDINSYNVQQLGIGRAFCDMGYDYDFITMKRRGPRSNFVFYQNGRYQAKCIEVPRFRFLRWGLNFNICKRDFLKQYDLVICQEYYQLMTYLVSLNHPKVALYNGPYYNMFMFKFVSPLFDALFTKRLDRQLKYKFVKSVLSYDYLNKKGYTNLCNIGVGLDTARFDCDVAISPETQKLMDFMSQHRCILYVGALSERKNYPFLLDVYEKLQKKYPDLKFVVIGKSNISAFKRMVGYHHEDYEEDVIKHRSPKVLDGIYRVNRIDNPQLKYIYPLAKAFLLPSKLEIFGMVLLEAMYLGAPVVSSANGGSATLIGGNEDLGIVVEKFDVEPWVNAVSKYIDDEEYRRKVIDNARQLIIDKYNWPFIIKQLLNVVNDEKK